MGHPKPYHRNIRPFQAGSHLGHGHPYAYDPRYARNEEHYLRAFKLIENDLQSIFEYLEPSDECVKAYSHRIHALLMRTCIEIEANFKAILQENKFTSKGERSFNMNAYRKVDVTHHLSDYKVTLPIWNGLKGVWTPFKPWKASRGLLKPPGIILPWYDAYNASKHDRQGRFKEANFGHLVEAVAGLAVLLSSQFKKDSAPVSLLLRVWQPEDWKDDEIYEFDWSGLHMRADAFAKFDYDAIPS